MHSTYSTAVFVNIALHRIVIHNTHREYHLVYLCASRYANAWLQMKPGGMDAAEFEPAWGGDKHLKFFIHVQPGGRQNQFDMKIAEAVSCLPPVHC